MPQENTLPKLANDDKNALKTALESYSKFVRSLSNALFREPPILGLAELDTNAETFVDSLRTAEKLRRALLRMTEEEQRLIQLFYWEGLSNAELAEQLDMLPPERLRQMKCRVIKKFQKMIAELELEETQTRHPSKDELNLINKINSIIPASKRKRYDELYTRFQLGKLTDAEHDELVELSDEFENLNAERLEYVGKLADLRGTSLAETINAIEK